GASKFRNKIKELNLGIEVIHASVDEIPKDTDIVVTHKTLIDRAKKSCPNAELIAIQNFLTDDNIQNLYNRLANK
ncbi:MAG: PTS mannitol transporter subunit IIBC, partial [Clostridium sp.]|nr:PTS mannitol transporter subunit IIBC [Clostridium sp.]